ncbi:MAG TPA: periplasmic heavy metal sensor [bacterium]
MRIFAATLLALVLAAPGTTSAQMMTEGMGGGMRPAGPVQPGMREMPAGMMGPGMMPGMMGGAREPMGGAMMSAGMMGPDMMGSAMSPGMDWAMPGKTRGCMMMAEGMMMGQGDLAGMRKALALSDEQAEKLRVVLAPFRREVILSLASLKVAELELADLVAGDKVDFDRVESKLKETEALRTKIRLVHFQAAYALRGVLSREQLEKLQGMGECGQLVQPAAPAAPAPPPQQPGGGAGGGTEHEQHH